MLFSFVPFLITIPVILCKKCSESCNKPSEHLTYISNKTNHVKLLRKCQNGKRIDFPPYFIPSGGSNIYSLWSPSGTNNIYFNYCCHIIDPVLHAYMDYDNNWVVGIMMNLPKYKMLVYTWIDNDAYIYLCDWFENVVLIVTR